jgi:hypothetical protein
VAGENGQDRVAAAATVTAETGVPITADTVGIVGCDYVDVRGGWTIPGRSRRPARCSCGRIGASRFAA